MDDATKQNLTNPNIWARGLYMVLFLIAYNIAELVLVLLAIFQFISVLITGNANEPLLKFGRNLSTYVEEIFEFLTFNSEMKPFPFEPWPDEEPGGEIWLDDEEPVVKDEPVAEEASVTIDGTDTAEVVQEETPKVVDEAPSETTDDSDEADKKS